MLFYLNDKICYSKSFLNIIFNYFTPPIECIGCLVISKKVFVIKCMHRRIWLWFAFPFLRLHNSSWCCIILFPFIPFHMVAEQLPKDEYFQYLSYQSCSFHILFYWYCILAVDKGTQLKSLLIIGFVGERFSLNYWPPVIL